MADHDPTTPADQDPAVPVCGACGQPVDQIEQHVGARRHQLAHLGRANSTEQTVYILHSHACRDSGIDLRACIYSRSLDRGIDPGDWAGREDQVVTLQVEHGMLLPDLDGPTDIVLVDSQPNEGGSLP